MTTEKEINSNDKNEVNFDRYATERIIELDYVASNQQSEDMGFYILDVKNAVSYKLCYSAVGMTDFPDLVERLSEYFFEHVFSKDREMHRFTCTPHCSEQLGTERKMALEKIVESYRQKFKKKFRGG